MRDDLHKSVPPRSAWAAALRGASKATDARLIQQTEIAIRKDANWLTSSWGRELIEVLDQGTGQMFVAERMREQILVMQSKSPDPHARAVCELALGALLQHGEVLPRFKDHVLQNALRIFATESIELLATRVAKQFGHEQSLQVRKKFLRILPRCDLLKEPAARKRRVRSSDADILNAPLHVKF
jgi:hypothetical protein